MRLCKEKGDGMEGPPSAIARVWEPCCCISGRPWDSLWASWETGMMPPSPQRRCASGVAQEAFLKAHVGLARLSELARFRFWLLRIVANEAVSRRRS